MGFALSTCTTQLGESHPSNSSAGLQILELAQTAYSSYLAKNPHEQARLVKTLVSNSTFDRGSLSPSYIKPFDVFASEGKTGDWLLRLDSNQQPSG
jgi:hypothetical protein